MNMSHTITQSAINAAEQFVRQELAGMDASHDYHHIHRVRANARRLAELEGLGADGVLLVDLSALLHDVRDWKYSGNDGATSDAVDIFLRGLGMGQDTIQRVLSIIASVGFKEELAAPLASGRPPLELEAAIVQDADRLDAIGAVGIARCFTFGGAKHRVLYDPAVPPREGLTKEQYMAGAAQATTINHFYEKLLKLKDLMKTESGRQIAEQRHSFMEQYLQQFMAEWDGQA